MANGQTPPGVGEGGARTRVVERGNNDRQWVDRAAGRPCRRRRYWVVRSCQIIGCCGRPYQRSAIGDVAATCRTPRAVAPAPSVSRASSRSRYGRAPSRCRIARASSSARRARPGRRSRARGPCRATTIACSYTSSRSASWRKASWYDSSAPARSPSMAAIAAPHDLALELHERPGQGGILEARPHRPEAVDVVRPQHRPGGPDHVRRRVRDVRVGRQQPAVGGVPVAAGRERRCGLGGGQVRQRLASRRSLRSAARTRRGARRPAHREPRGSRRARGWSTSGPRAPGGRSPRRSWRPAPSPTRRCRLPTSAALPSAVA